MSTTLLNAIGNTPLLDIQRLNPNPAVRILAKLEYLNPGGSIKDRPALTMIEEGEKSGALKPGMTVIEATSGNTGIGLAMVCAVKGYPLLLTMSESASMERQQILKARGADILLTPGHLGTDGAIEEVYNLARENPDKYFMADQYNNPANWKAHYTGTGPEIWQQTNGTITALVATMGTTGTLMGLSRYLKEKSPAIRIIGVEPYLKHKLQGLKNMKEAYRPEIYEKNRLDEIIKIDDAAAFAMTRRLAAEEGLLVGMSSGAAMVIAAQLSAAMTDGTLVVIFPDGGERYLSTSLFSVQTPVTVQLFDTATRKRIPFTPMRPGKVSIYSCGPTVHRRMHLSECRRYIFSDLLCRHLNQRGYTPQHVINITDFDDNTIHGADAAGQDLKTFTDTHISEFKEDLATLGILPAQHYPRVSEHLDDMVALADRLVNRNAAYERFRSLYFDVDTCADYGRFSGVDLEKIRLGATVDLDEYEKDNPRDFTLLKRSRLSELKQGHYVRTPWGNVRPSLHLQCAAISMKYLGETFDIHTSSSELIFPHHENETAIARAATGKPLARYWLHVDPVLLSGKKMQENLGMITLPEVLSLGYSAQEVRFWMISTHYRRPMEFSTELLDAAAHSLKRIDCCIRALSAHTGGVSHPDIDPLLCELKDGFIDALDDDLNISAALAVVFNTVKQANRLLDDKQLDTKDAAKLLTAFKQIDATLKVMDFRSPKITPEVEALIARRDQARREGDWETADRIRDELLSAGIDIHDEKAGTA
ncbi:MAG: cysteine--tRNA ligase [Deltaproteobacteria bacterium]|nr:MAG: cysteine--tRNA ligase [Deltaproteobacteria bacterium]